MRNSEFYKSNYQVIQSQPQVEGAKRIILGGLHKRCRICDRDEGSTKFKNHAHVVPEFTGIKFLLSNYECDECNKRFGELESDFGAMSHIGRAIGGVPRKKSGSATYNSKSGNFRMQRSGNHMKIDYKSDETGIFRENGTKYEVELNLQSRPFRPLAVFKAMAKIGYMLLPEELLPEFSHLKAWLQEKDLSTGRHLGIYGHGCFVLAIPGWSPIRPEVTLLARSSDVDAPFCVLGIMFGHFLYQAIVPCPNQDHRSTGKQVSLRSIAVTYDYHDPHHVPLEPIWRDLSGLDKVVESQSWVARGQPAN